jgi:hypothetical protein
MQMFFWDWLKRQNLAEDVFRLAEDTISPFEMAILTVEEAKRLAVDRVRLA